MGIPNNVQNGPGSEQYHDAFIGILVAACVYFGLLILELFTLSFGLSVLFKKINAIQVLLHGLGVLGGGWMILETWHWAQLFTLAFFFGFLPFLLEFSVIFAARNWMRTFGLIQERMTKESKRQNAIYKQRQEEVKAFQKNLMQ